MLSNIENGYIKAAVRQSNKKQEANLLSYNFLTDIDIAETICINAETPITIPTYVEANDELVHPSILFYPQKWNGYRYWMGFTPFTGADSQYENPSIAASNDGINFVVPSGLTNPIVTAPALGYNADINIIADPDGVTMHMIWKESYSTNIIYLSSSTDAINWTPKKVLFNTVLATKIDASPKILHDGEKYIMWSVDVVPSPNILTIRTSNQIDSGWSEPVTCTINLPVNRDIWHIDICKVGSTYYMVYSDCIINQSGSACEFYFAKSHDGITWISTTTQLIKRGNGKWDSNPYKATMLPQIKNGELSFRLWYGVSSGAQGQTWAVGVTDITFNKTKKTNDYNNSILQGINSINNYIFCDTFNRADADVTVSTSGGPWINNTGAGLKVVSHKAFIKTAGNTISLFDTGLLDYEVSLEIHATTYTCVIFVRSKNTTSYVRFGAVDGSYALSKYDGSAATVLQTLIGSAVIGDVIKVRCVGDNIKCYVNDNLRADVIEEMNNTDGTYVGVQMSNVAACIDNFLVKKIV